MQIKEINKKFIQLVKENPDLPIKVFISGECYADDGCWFAGDVYGCEVTEIVSYEMYDEPRYYTKDDIDEIAEYIEEYICDEDEYKNLSDEELEKVAKQKAEELEWEGVILIRVGV